MNKNTCMLTDDNYSFACECEKIIKNAKELNITVVDNILDREAMICKIMLDNNVTINMQRDISYNYVDKEHQDIIEIAMIDKNHLVSFIINRNNNKSNIFVSSMKNYEVERVLSIEPHVWYSISKLNRGSKGDVVKSMLNTNLEEKYMRLLVSFVKYLKDNCGADNIDDGFLLVKEQIGDLIQEIIEPYELKSSKSKKRVKNKKSH